MKRFLFLSLSFFIINIAGAQDTDLPFNKKNIPINDDKKVTYTLVGEVPKVSKEQLYDQALAWISEAFTDDAGVIKLQDKDAGTIVAEGSTEEKYHVKTLGVLVPKKYYQNMKIEFNIKEGRYRLIITAFKIENIAARFGNSYLPSSTNPIEKYYDQVPDIYTFSKLTSLERTQLFSAKTILTTADKFAKSTLSSVKNYMANAANPVKKDDW